jgi:hypothetical protein
VDAWIDTILEKKGLSASSRATRETLIRRVTWDMTGLPPSVEEIEAFVKDPNPDAYERLVDRLLADPNYGVQWGQHWLDVVRYSESNGFERDEFRPTIWRFRNYVIDAFNQDLPFDQFVGEQLAGDELNQLDPSHPRRGERLAATGYLRLGPWDKFKQFFDSADAARDELMVDLTNTTGTAFLGQSLSCCRCHDHMTDPLLQSDHYRFRAYFAAIEFDNEVILDEPKLANEISEHNARIDDALKRLESARGELTYPAKRKIATATIVGDPEIMSLDGFLVLPTLSQEEIVKLVSDLDLEDDDSAVLEFLSRIDRDRVIEMSQEMERLEKQKRPHTTIWGVQENTECPPKTYVLDRGEFVAPLENVEPGTFAIFGESPSLASFNLRSKTTFRRLTLARWIASPQNPWTARVFVNRVWYHHFGRGICPNPDDIGISGGPPTHPELLDELALQFIQHGWSPKSLHRQILLTSAYTRSSDVLPANQEIDPENQWLARYPLRSLGAESLRDGILAVTGNLDSRSCGPPRWPQVSQEDLTANPAITQPSSRLQGYYTSPPGTANVRSVYLVRKRTVPNPVLATYGLPDASVACGRRHLAMGTPQALSLLNGSWVDEATMEFAQRYLASSSASATALTDSQVQDLFRTLLARSATQHEVAWVHQSMHDLLYREGLVSDESATHDNPMQMALAVAEIARALINSNEFFFVE